MSEHEEQNEHPKRVCPQCGKPITDTLVDAFSHECETED